MKPIISLQRVPPSQTQPNQNQVPGTIKHPFLGFTLIELIVVITILAILGTIGFISIGGYSSKARDSARLGDISNMSKSLDLAIITIGSYPTPDAPALTVTYSGGTIWTQGFIGSTVLQAFRSSIAGGGLNKKPVDPLDSTEYTYSSLAYGKAYQIKANYEGDLAQTAWNLPELTTEVKAAPGTPTIAYIKGNYGGLTAKTIVGEFTYVLAVPSIITSLTGTGVREIGTGNTLSGTLLFNGKSLKNASSFNPTTVVYTSTGGTPATTTELTTLITNLKSAYTPSDITSNQNIASLLATTGTSAITSLGTSIVTNQLGGKVNTSTSGNSGGNTQTASWTSIDPNCTKPDVTIGGQVWAGCNSTIGSIAINYNNGACYNYAGSNVGGSACYGTTTTENWSGISTSAVGYSGAISGISTNIYGALYQYDTMSGSTCLGTGIPASNTTCPCKGGYHIPTQAEWDTLETTLGCSGVNKLTGDATGWECMTSTTDTTSGLGWTSNNPNSLKNQLGLTLAGYCYGGSCNYRGNNASYWSASVYAPSPTGSWYRYLNYSFASVTRHYNTATYAFSARCLRD